MRYYLDDDLWTTFAEATEEWALKHDVDEILPKYSFQEAVDVVRIMACSTDIEPEDGEFSAHFLTIFARHLRLQQAVEGKSVALSLRAVERLWSSIGNRYNFKISSDVIQKLLDVGSGIEYVSDLPRCENLEHMVESVKRLSKIASGISVSKGSLSLDNGFSDKVFQYLDKKMAQLGGREFVAHYTERARMAQLYYQEFDRYLICRRDYFGERQEPVHFLLHLAAKHFSAHPARRWEYQKDLHDEIISVATDFLEVCDLQGKSGIGLSMMDPKEVTYHLVDELFFYKMCIPSQYSSRFILSSLRYLIKDWFAEAGLRYDYHDYYAVAEYFLGRNWWEEKRFQSLDEIHLATGVAKYKLKIILDDISLPINKINKEFTAFDAHTNFFEYPLIYDTNLGYCCFDRILCGRGFLVRINQLIKRNKQDLDKVQGLALERWLREEMMNKGYEVKYGKYPASAGLKEGDCDFVLEDGRIHFFELKKQEVVKDFDEVDDVGLWGALGKGMIRAQKQCFAHELYLRKNGAINLSTGMTITLKPNNLPASKISVCFSEYSYIASKAYAVLLLKAIFKIREVMAKNAERQKELIAFNKYIREILDIIEEQNTLMERKISIEELLPYSLFCSLQQILTAIWNTSSEKEFLEVIEEWMLRIDGSTDHYIMLFKRLNGEPDIVSQAMLDFAKNRDVPPLIVS